MREEDEGVKEREAEREKGTRFKPVPRCMVNVNQPQLLLVPRQTASLNG